LEILGDYWEKLRITVSEEYKSGGKREDLWAT